MHVNLSLCHPWGLFRLLTPSRYQTYHTDWQFQGIKGVSRYSDSRIMRLVSLFGVDAVYVANPEAIVEIATNPTRYPKAVELYGNSSLSPGAQIPGGNV
jgi:hypothetical protein